MPTRLRAFAFLLPVALLAAGCSTVTAPIGLPMQTKADSQTVTKPISTVRSLSALSKLELISRDAVDVTSVRSTTVATTFEQAVLPVNLSVSASIAATNAKCTTTKSQESFGANDEKLKLKWSDFQTFLDRFDDDVLRPVLIPNSVEPEANATPSPPTFRDIQRAYLTSLMIGKYVDRSGRKITAPSFDGGISNETLSLLLRVFFDGIIDSRSTTKILRKEPGKDAGDNPIFYPSGTQEKPTLIVLYESRGVPFPEDRYLKVVDDPKGEKPGDIECWPKHQMPVAKARLIGAIAQLAEKRSALATGLLIETFGGIDLGFVVGGRISVGDNKTAVELAKRVLSATAYHAAEQAALSFFWNNDFDPKGRDAFLLNLLLQTGKEEEKKK